jgi:exopolyphosphatase
MSTLQRFLHGARSRINSIGSTSKITICVGNEAADLDSIMSALSIAYVQENMQRKGIDADRIYVPVVAVPRNILKLRSEAEILLDMVGVTSDDLICMEDLDIVALSESSRLHSFILTDHNKLSKDVTNLLINNNDEYNNVEMIFDHHKDLNAYPNVKGDKYRRIAFDEVTNKATAGSACTLISEYITELTQDPENNTNFQDISILLQGVICIDTQNMSSMSVGTERDQIALNNLKQYISNKVDRNHCFNLLRNAKYNSSFWESLTSKECFFIDYKSFLQRNGTKDIDVGVASILLPLEKLVKKSTFIEDIVEYIDRPSLGSGASTSTSTSTSTSAALDILAVMSSVIEPVHKKEILIATYNEERLDGLVQFLNASESDLGLTNLELDLESEIENSNTMNNKIIVPGGRILHLRWFNVGNLKASRKQFAPLVNNFYDSLPIQAEEAEEEVETEK